MNKQEKFILSLYEMSSDELKELYRFLRSSRDKLLQNLANIMLEYNIVDGFMDIGVIDKTKLSANLEKILKDDFNKVSLLEVKVIDEVLFKAIDNTSKFWNYNIEFNDVRNIIEKHYKGKHFSDRVWDNEQAVAKKINALMNDFLDGKVGVNQIKKELERSFDSGAYETRRLVETEVARVEDESFKRFCRETDVKKIKRNAILDTGTCEDCSNKDGDVHELDKAPSLPEHPLCRCFWEIVE